MTRSILARLIALALITVAGGYYIAFDAIGVKLTNQPYTIHVVMPTAGGIYTDAYVTYRGVEVGKVSALHLERNQVVADLAINHGQRIPADVDADVRELTAAAEQYFDLVPAPPSGQTTTSGEYLTAGSTIPASRVKVPVTVGTLLNTVNSLVDSLSAKDLNTLTSSLATGLQGAGGDLHSIITNGDTLVTALQSAIPGTAQLINSGNQVLGTFNATSNQFADFSHNLDVLSAQVAKSNSDLVALLRNGATAGQTLGPYLQQHGPSTVQFIDAFAQSTGVAYANRAAFQALFQVLPLFSTDVAETTSGGQVHFELTFNYKNTVCPYTSQMASPTALVAVASLTGNCAMSAPDLLQRGADKAPGPQG